MKNNSKIYLPLLLGLVCAAGVLLGSRLNFSGDQELFSSNSKKEKLSRLIDYIDYEYVDDVNTDSIVDLTVNRILENLDPHSVYISRQEYVGMTENMQGDFVGIGVSFYTVRDSIAVIQPLDEGPSKEIGIRPGDRILYANGEPLFSKDLNNEQIISRLKGEEGSKVKLGVYRPGEDKLLEFTVKRDRVPLKSVDAAYMLTENLGYLKVNRFAETTYKELKQGLKQLKKEGATGIVLDLRDNPGGYVAEAIKMADEFLKDGQMILFTKNKKGAVEETWSTSRGDFEDSKLYVLINENSASASEIVAGAFQDNDRGLIIGRRSYGKGLVQREMELGDGSAVRLTIARYYTPTGRSIQRPYDSGNEDYFNEYVRRYRNGELASIDSIQIADSLRYKTPGGKIVYGGGGIIPDVFVSKDTNLERENLLFFLRDGFLNRFVFDVMEKDRTFYNSLSKEEFYAADLVTEDIIKDFFDFARHPNFPSRLAEYRETLKNYIKAVMAQQLFGSAEYQKIVNKEDRIVKKVIEISETK